MAMGSTDLVIVVVCAIVFVVVLLILSYALRGWLGRHCCDYEPTEAHRLRRLREQPYRVSIYAPEAEQMQPRRGPGGGVGQALRLQYLRELEELKLKKRPQPPPPPPPCSPRRLQTLDENLLCMICYERERDVIFQPCYHCFTCGYCASLLQYDAQPCPLCRSAITEIVKVEFMKVSQPEDGGASSDNERPTLFPSTTPVVPPTLTAPPTSPTELPVSNNSNLAEANPIPGETLAERKEIE